MQGISLFISPQEKNIVLEKNFNSFIKFLVRYLTKYSDQFTEKCEERSRVTFFKQQFITLTIATIYLFVIFLLKGNCQIKSTH